MKIELRRTKAKGIIQITTLDERFYLREKDGAEFPSSSWISSYIPKDMRFYKWLAQTGWNEAQMLKELGGNKGSKVHQAIEQGETTGIVTMKDRFTNPTTGLQEEITLEEYECVMSFLDWHNTVKPKLIESEQVVYCIDGLIKYAGTLDRIYEISGQRVLIDFKTSQGIYPEHIAQLSSYKHALPLTGKNLNRVVDRMAILQIGYKANRQGWKYTEVPDRYDLFCAAYVMWEYYNPDTKPRKKDYPTKLVFGPAPPMKTKSKVLPKLKSKKRGRRHGKR